MAEPKAVRVRESLKQFGELQERRMRSKAKAVAEGDIPHLRQMSVQELLDGARRNLAQIEPGASREKVMQAAEDAANFAMFAAAKCAEATQE